ncbi:MAG: methyltransferase [Lachnospiraceae bacterium]|nr:methyltransferase [Lachnospiraceae bacterium]
MLKKYLNIIESGKDVKANLLELKNYLKGQFEESSEDLEKAAVILKGSLADEDPKIRKNSAYCLGFIGDKINSEDITEVLYESYLSDDTKYNKAAYLEALGHLDISSVRDDLLKHREELCSLNYAAEDKKHILEEISELNRILRDVIEKEHEFTGYSLINEAVLLTNRNFKNITIDELKNIPHKEFTAGVMVKTKNIRKVMDCRTFTELLFIPDDLKVVEKDAEAAARTMIEGGLIDYLEQRHSNPDAPFYFRVEFRGKDEKKKADLEKRMAGEIELASHWKLINSTSDYDLEFRFIENSAEKLQFLIGMRAFPDMRFDYRKKTISAGMKPSLAALLVRLSADYIKDNAAVLDPMCGSGIFLIERNKYRSARIMYGVDIFGEAVAAAKENVKAAGISSKCELINKDIIEFKHQFKFDEIITDMPRITSGKDRSLIEKLYMDFLAKAKGLMEENGSLFIFTHNRDILRKYTLKYSYTIKAEFEISKMEEAYYFILKR